MKLLPSLRLSVADGWLLLVPYFLGLTISALAFPRDKRKKLFFKPAYRRDDRRALVRLAGTIAAIAFVSTMLATPLQTGSALLGAGFAVYALGFVLVVVSLLEFRRAPLGRPVTTGIYRVSRNPQWIGLVLVYLGAALAVATWFHLVLLTVMVITYHYQILLEESVCSGFYGDEYAAYLRQVPRYAGRPPHPPL
jgi:protein-S-isoprenylcysteine O-methyltransferase Ste14